jgi:hypothetical protein
VPGKKGHVPPPPQEIAQRKHSDPELKNNIARGYAEWVNVLASPPSMPWTGFEDVEGVVEARDFLDFTAFNEQNTIADSAEDQAFKVINQGKCVDTLIFNSSARRFDRVQDLDFVY